MSPDIGWFFRNFTMNLWNSRREASSMISTFWFPVAEIALRFLAPVTAPTPVRPATRCPEAMQA